jgi:hypothetical protein
MPRLFAAVLSTTVGLAFWWALTEPLPLPAPILYSAPAVFLFMCGIMAGRLGLAAAPIAFVFSLLLGSLIATQLHQSFAPQHLPVSRFGPLTIDGAELAWPLVITSIVGLIGGIVGERMLPTRAEWPGR